MPAPVLFAPETFNLAEVTRGIEVARRLATRRPVLFCGFSRRYADRIVQAGFEFRLLSPELSEHEADQLLALDQGKALRNPLTASVMSRRVAAERHLIHRSGAAGVVIGSTVSQFISARAEARPLVYLKPFAYSAAHIATMRSTGLWPATGRWARSWDRAGAAAARAVLPRLRLLPPGWRRLAAQNGVRLPPSSTDFLEADLNLITTPAPFLPQPMQLPVSYAVVGPISARLDAAIPEEVRAAADRAAPVVYVAVGSSGGREVVLPILHGMAGAPVSVIAPAGHLLTGADRAALPQNVHVTGWLPAHRLGSLVDIAITHGGEGTVQNSLEQGWPMILAPLQWEQRFTAVQSTRLGLARFVPPRRLRSADWPALVREVLADAAMRERVHQLRQQLSAMDGPSRAAQEISRVLAG
ncbi:MAG TPA: nucleotide disphospho-sugar-binding domain-containing protein [Ruania sp.]|nr:nucleotide disphospho-sugar-binding domain-containing protein [Ruania sp.]